MSKQIYSAYHEFLLNPADNESWDFDILNPRRNMQLNSVAFFTHIVESLTSKETSLPDNSLNQQVWLFVGTLGGSRFTRSVFNSQSKGGVPFVPVANGDQLLFTRPGQYVFDSAFISESLHIQFMLANLDVVKSVSMSLQIIIEVTE